MRTVDKDGNVHHETVHDLQNGDMCFLIYEYEYEYKIHETTYNESAYKHKKLHGDICLTQKDAEYEILLRKSRAFSGGFRPKIGDWYYFAYNDGTVLYVPYNNDVTDNAYYAIGNMHPTKEQTQEWYEKHGKKLFSYYE